MIALLKNILDGFMYKKLLCCGLLLTLVQSVCAVDLDPDHVDQSALKVASKHTKRARRKSFCVEVVEPVKNSVTSRELQQCFMDDPYSETAQQEWLLSLGTGAVAQVITGSPESVRPESVREVLCCRIRRIAIVVMSI